MVSLSTCHLGLWLGWQILLNLVNALYYILHHQTYLPSIFFSSFDISRNILFAKLSKYVKNNI